MEIKSKVSVANELDGNLHGLTRTLINNMVEGCEKEFTRTLQINGVGYRAQKTRKQFSNEFRIFSSSYYGST